MVNKCAAPNCSIGYKMNGHKLTTFRFPTDKEIKKKWACAVPREGWKPSGHFVESDFQVEQEDTNSTRKKSCAKETVRRKLKRDAIPSKWPDCPKLLTKPVSNKRTASNALSSAWEESATLRQNLLEEEIKNNDTFASLEELDDKLGKGDLSSDITRVYKEGCRLFLCIAHWDNLVIKYGLCIYSSLKFDMWCNGINIKNVRNTQVPILPDTLTSCSLFKNLLEYLRRKCCGQETLGDCNSVARCNILWQ